MRITYVVFVQIYRVFKTWQVLIGRLGGNVGSYAGNYRASFFNGLPQYIGENPFKIELDGTKPANVKTYWKAESVHYFNHGDSISNGS